MDNKLSELKYALECLEGAKYDSCHTSWLCDYIVAASPSNIRALLAELEAKSQRITGLERHVKDIEATLIAATDEIADLTKERDEFRRRFNIERPYTEDADQRIARLEAKLSEMTTPRDNALKKTLRYWEELLKLRAKLATPVRLPYYDKPKRVGTTWEDGFGNGVHESAEAIRAAGFTVERDE